MSAEGGGPLPGLRLVDKPARVRSLGTVEVEALRRRTAHLSETVWRREDEAKENDFLCFHHTRHIIFRFIEGFRDPRRFYSQPIWALWQPMLLPVMARAAAPYGYADPVFPKVMLARLEAGYGIDLHVDGGRSNPYVHKIHVPLVTNPRGRPDRGRRGLPSRGRACLRGQQPRAPRRVQRRRGGPHPPHL